jgi:NADPH2:quinone reductase
MHRAIAYSRHGDASVLELVEQPTVDPGEGEVRIRLHTSGVNPTDWKSRSGGYGGGLDVLTVANHDGAGVVDAVGPGVASHRVGDRVWITLAGHHRPTSGTAQDSTVVPAERAFPLPNVATFELGAAIGIPACTAHRALTVAEDGPTRLTPGAFDGHLVLVAGGAGAVGNAAIQLAAWAGATVISTVSSNEKARLARAAGAQHVVNYRDADAAEQIRRIAPDGVHLVVEVAAGTNADLDLAVIARRGTVAIYATEGGAPFTPDVARSMGLNARYQFVLLYEVGWDRIASAATDINQAINCGAYCIGDSHGLPVHRFTLEETAAAHRASEDAAVGKVLIEITPPGHGEHPSQQAGQSATIGGP